MLQVLFLRTTPAAPGDRKPAPPLPLAQHSPFPMVSPSAVLSLGSLPLPSLSSSPSLSFFSPFLPSYLPPLPCPQPLSHSPVSCCLPPLSPLVLSPVLDPHCTSTHRPEIGAASTPAGDRSFQTPHGRKLRAWTESSAAADLGHSEEPSQAPRGDKCCSETQESLWYFLWRVFLT